MIIGVYFDHPQSPYIIQRKFQKIQRKISLIGILNFLVLKPIKKLFVGIGLLYLGPDASFDTLIDICRHDICWMTYMSFMSLLPKMTYFMSMELDTHYA